MQLTDMKLVNMVILLNMWEFDNMSSWSLHYVSLDHGTVDPTMHQHRSKKKYDSNDSG